MCPYRRQEQKSTGGMQTDGLKSLRKGLDVLGIFRASENDELSLTEIAQLSGLSNATVSRILSTLVEAGFLRQRERRGKYSLGTVYLEFGRRIKQSLSVRDVALPYATALNETVKETIILTLWERNNAEFHEAFDRCRNPNDMLRVVPVEAATLPLHATAPGKIRLADMNEEDLRDYLLGDEMQRYTARTITDPEVLRAGLAAVRTEGVAFDSEEYRLGISSLAAGIRNADHRLVGAVTILAPTVRLGRKVMIRLTPTVRNCALQISADLGAEKRVG